MQYLWSPSTPLSALPSCKCQGLKLLDNTNLHQLLWSEGGSEEIVNDTCHPRGPECFQPKHHTIRSKPNDFTCFSTQIKTWELETHAKEKAQYPIMVRWEMNTWCLSNGDRLWRMESCTQYGGKWFVLKWHGDERRETGCKMSCSSSIKHTCNRKPAADEQQTPSSKHFLIWWHSVQTCTYIPNLTWSLVSTVCFCLCTPTWSKLSEIATAGQCQYVKRIPH